MFFLLLLALCITFETYMAELTFKGQLEKPKVPMTWTIIKKDPSVPFSDKCRRMNGRLARIENAEKQRDLYTYIMSYRNYDRYVYTVLVDGQRGEGSKWRNFYYSDGTPINHTNWQWGEPNNWPPIFERCIEIYLKTMEKSAFWNDIPCASPNHALCEVPATWTIIKKDPSVPFSDKCRRINGRLARIENAEDQRAVGAFLRWQNRVRGSLLSVLVDGQRGEGSKKKNFYYSDGTQINYTNWAKGEPNSWNYKCLEIIATDRYGHSGKWNDVRCAWPKHALCKLNQPKKDKEGSVGGDKDKEGSVGGDKDKEGSVDDKAPKTFEVVFKDRSDRSPKTLPEKCRRLNGRLALIENAEKQKEVELFLSQFYGLHSVIVDGQRGSGSNWRKFYFSDGTRIRYTNWNKGEPRSWKEKCIEVLVKDNDLFGKWNDVVCSKPWAALCEF